MDTITIERIVKAPLPLIWEVWNTPKHIMNWSYATEGWTTPFAEVDLRVGGMFKIGYGSPDGNNDFTFEGTYTEIDEPHLISYRLEDERCVTIKFEEVAEGTKITQTFDAENENSMELQRDGWSEILKHFDGYISNLK